MVCRDDGAGTNAPSNIINVEREPIIMGSVWKRRLEPRDTQARLAPDGARIRRDFAGQNLQQRRLRWPFRPMTAPSLAGRVGFCLNRVVPTSSGKFRIAGALGPSLVEPADERAARRMTTVAASQSPVFAWTKFKRPDAGGPEPIA